MVFKYFEDAIEDIILKYTDPKVNPEEWEWDNMRGEFNLLFLTDVVIPKEMTSRIKQEEVLDFFLDKAKERFGWREKELPPEVLNELLKFVLLGTIDSRWREHLYALDALREGINLRAYAQKDPLIEYKQESFKMFDDLMSDVAKDITGLVFRAQPGPMARKPLATREYKPSADGKPGSTTAAPQGLAPVAAQKKVGRNDPCPCGSGKKYKKCHGRNAA